MSFGSTGKLYAQIKHGAPYDAFLAADVRRPKLLEEEGVAVTGSRFTYAIGQVALWSTHPDLVDSNGNVLASDSFRHLALANPAVAPYGEAARDILRSKGVWETLQPKLVMGQNIAQTYQFVDTENAALGFVAYSQLLRSGDMIEGSYWLPPQSLYAPIEQQAIILKESESVRVFMDFMRLDQAIEIIRRYGYEVPDAE